MMEKLTKPTLLQLSSQRPAALERIPEPRSKRFSQLLSDTTDRAKEKPAIVACSTLCKSVTPRSTRFANSLNIEQRTSTVDDKDFLLMPAALESMRRAVK